MPRFRTLKDRPYEQYTHHRLQAVPLLKLQQNLDMCHFRALVRYCLSQHTVYANFHSIGYQAPRDALGDLALLFYFDSRLGGFQICHNLLQQSLNFIN